MLLALGNQNMVPETLGFFRAMQNSNSPNSETADHYV